MKFSLDKQEKYAIFSIDEEKINAMNAPMLKSELTLLHSEGYHNIIMDLNKVQYCDSSGLSALLLGKRVCQSSEGSFVLAAPQSGVEKLIELSRLQDVLRTTPTVSEACDLVMMEELERELRSSDQTS